MSGIAQQNDPDAYFRIMRGENGRMERPGLKWRPVTGLRRMRVKPYDPAYCDLIQQLALLGATRQQMADTLKVSVSTLYCWRDEFPEFRAAMEPPLEVMTAEVERSLYRRAVGYDYNGVKVLSGGPALPPVLVPIVEHMPGDVKAQTTWLQAHKPETYQKDSASASATIIQIVANAYDEAI